MRSKVAVAARQANVDPVGSCVGMKGQRIQKIVDELGGEEIDVVLWDPDMSVYIANALSPAQVLSVDLDEEQQDGLGGCAGKNAVAGDWQGRPKCSPGRQADRLAN